VDPISLLPKIAITPLKSPVINLETENTNQNSNEQKLNPNYRELLPYKSESRGESESDQIVIKKNEPMRDKFRDLGFTSPYGSYCVFKKRKNSGDIESEDNPRKKRKLENSFAPVILSKKNKENDSEIIN